MTGPGRFLFYGMWIDPDEDFSRSIDADDSKSCLNTSLLCVCNVAESTMH